MNADADADADADPPVARPPVEGPPVQWRSDVHTTQTTSLAQAQTEPRTFADAIDDEEKLIGRNNLVPVSFLELGLRAARPVAYLGSGTGFLVDADHLITNNHVIPDVQTAKSTVAWFNYQHDVNGKLLPIDEFKFDPGAFFHTNVELDYTVVRMRGHPGAIWGSLPLLADLPVEVGQYVAIIQHPAGQKKQVALSDNEVAFVDDRVVQYLTDTLPGSSGSPVFDEKWRVVALHHSGHWIPEPDGTSTHFRNEGIRISAILRDLPALQPPPSAAPALPPASDAPPAGG
jgi:V8-like Glu-specific endopeptidase